jgi:hypothetical protein
VLSHRTMLLFETLLTRNLLYRDGCKIVTNVLQTSQEIWVNIAMNNASMGISGSCFRASAITTMNKKPTRCTIVLKSLKLLCICDELITRPEKSYRIWCVVVCYLENSWMRRPWPKGGGAVTQKIKKLLKIWIHKIYVQLISSFSTQLWCVRRFPINAICFRYLVFYFLNSHNILIFPHFMFLS